MRNMRTIVVMTTALLLGNPVAGALEFLGIRSDAMAHVSQTRPELSPVAQYQINRANNQNADFVK